MTKQAFGLVVIACLFVVLTGIPSAVKGEDLTVRGKYLVEHVAMCGDCHTPHLPNGQPDRARWLRGAPVGFKPIHPMPSAAAAPPIAGLPTLSEAQVIKFLKTGLGPDGKPPLPPMPPYRLSHRDAQAVAAYLKSPKGEN